MFNIKGPMSMTCSKSNDQEQRLLGTKQVLASLLSVQVLMLTNSAP